LPHPINYLIDPATLFFANMHPAHQIGEALVSGLVAVDEPFNRHNWFAWI